MPKIEEVEKKSHPQVRKRRNKWAITRREEMLGKLARKWKGDNIIIKVFENNKDSKKEEAKKRDMS